MKIDGALLAADLRDTGAAARAIEAQGFDGLLSFEGAHDPFLPLAAAAEHTTRVELTTAIAIAFARNPMVCAYLANDLQLLSGGRFVLGLGTQIRPHIEKRFGQPWSKPNARMREFVQAMRAIWRAWETGERLEFRGEFYTHTLMTPFFSPGPNPHGRPPIALAGFGPRHDRGRRRGRRRLDRPPAQLAQLRRGGRLAGARARPRPRRSRASRRRDRLPDDRDDRLDRRRDRHRAREGEGPDRLLRIDAGVSRHARPPRLGPPAARAEPHVEAGAVVRDDRGS